MKFCVSAVVAGLLISSGFAAQHPEFHGHLPIDLPDEASVNFEADAPASDLVPLIQQVLSGNLGDPRAAASSKISVKTPLGSFDVDPKDLALILRPVRELHIVSFNTDRSDAMKHYEHQFHHEGLDKVNTPGGSDTVLFMKDSHGDGRYAVVVKQGKQVTVVRTDGMPDLGSVGDLALRKLAEEGSRIRSKVKF